MYKDPYEKTKGINKQDVYMKFYDTLKLLHLETDTSGNGLGNGGFAGHGWYELWVR